MADQLLEMLNFEEKIQMLTLPKKKGKNKSNQPTKKKTNSKTTTKRIRKKIKMKRKQENPEQINFSQKNRATMSFETYFLILMNPKVH